MRTLWRHFDLVMLAVCVLAFLAQEHGGGARWAGIGLVALGLTGVVGGGVAIVRRRLDEVIDGETGHEVSYRGLAAVSAGLERALPGLLAVALGAAVTLEVTIGPWVRSHLGALAAAAGLWLAARGTTLLLGSEEDRPETRWHLLLQPFRLVGLILALAGLALAVFGLLAGSLWPPAG